MYVYEHLDEFNKIILDLANIDDEDQAVLLLSSLDTSYANLKETMTYGRETLTLDDVQSVLHSRELQNKAKNKPKTGEGLTIRGRLEKHSHKGKNNKVRSKSKGKQLKCFVCHKE